MAHCRDSDFWRMLDPLLSASRHVLYLQCHEYLQETKQTLCTCTAGHRNQLLDGKRITLLADIPEFFPARILAADYHYIGPLTWKRDIPPPLWWHPKKDDKPLIYITMGTTGIPDFFHKVYELFKESVMPKIRDCFIPDCLLGK